ncbi:MAG: YbfB/YjiJ family MFS transporter [Actinobacteria bacterium]|nr:YbfB/YjiJ family MFS transporter [Actinomycetota bacterium]
MRPTRSPGYRWVVLSMAFMGVFAALGFGRFGYSAVLPAMQDALGINSAAAGSLASWNLAGYTIMSAVGGVLAAKLGARRVVTAGITITAAGMMVTGLADGLALASVGRLLAGVGNGMVLVPSVTLMAAWFESGRLGFASSIVSAGSSLAMVIVGLAVPRIITAGGEEGWRHAWYFFAGITIALAVVNVIVQRDRPHDPTPKRLDIKLDRSAPRALRTRMKAPALDLRSILRSGYAWHLGLVYMLYGVGFLIYFTFFQKRLTSDLGYSAAEAGYFFLLLGLAGLAGGALWGSVSDRIGRKRAVALTLVVCGVAAVLFAATSAAFPLAISAVLFGSAGPAVPGLIGVACNERFGAVLASASLGFVTILVGLGQTFGPYLGGVLSDVFSGLGPTYYFSGGVFILGAAGALALREGGPPMQEQLIHGRPRLPVKHAPLR